MAQATNPYGDGMACGRIIEIIEENFAFVRGGK